VPLERREADINKFKELDRSSGDTILNRCDSRLMVRRIVQNVDLRKGLWIDN
jgi:hypothetical protein